MKKEQTWNTWSNYCRQDAATQIGYIPIVNAALIKFISVWVDSLLHCF